MSQALNKPLDERTAGTCPECKSKNIIKDDDVGERVCGSCGFVLERLVATTISFEDGTGRGTTVPHLPDKNLPTTFNLRDVKDPEKQEAMRRLERLNKMTQQHNGASTKFRLQKQLRPILEKVPMLFSSSSSRYQRDPVGEALIFASNLVVKKKPPQEPLLQESLALLSIIHSDVMRTIQPGFDAILNFIAGPQITVKDQIQLRPTIHGTWYAEHCFTDSSLIGSFLNIVVSFKHDSRQFNIKAPVELCGCMVGRVSPVTIHRRFDVGRENQSVYLWVSPRRCEVGKPLKMRLRLPPMLQNLTIAPKVSIEPGKKRQIIKKTYRRLCLHYGLPFIPLTFNRLIDEDKTLNSDERRTSQALAAKVHQYVSEMPNFQRPQQNLIAATSVAKSVSQPRNTVARRYGVNEMKLAEMMKKIKILQSVGP